MGYDCSIPCWMPLSAACRRAQAFHKPPLGLSWCPPALPVLLLGAELHM